MPIEKHKSVEVVQFNERFCGKKQLKATERHIEEIPEIQTTTDNGKIFNIKKARYEIMRFALTGFDKERRKQDKIAMAIRLGAKPPKREHKNYKELMDEKKKAKESKKNELPNKYTIQKLKGRKSNKKKKKKDQPSSLM